MPSFKFLSSYMRLPDYRRPISKNRKANFPNIAKLLNFLPRLNISKISRIQKYDIENRKNQIFVYRGITPKCVNIGVTSGRAHLRGLGPWQAAPKKRDTGGEPLASLCRV